MTDIVIMCCSVFQVILLLVIAFNINEKETDG
jgi:hypothetical protein